MRRSWVVRTLLLLVLATAVSAVGSSTWPAATADKSTAQRPVVVLIRHAEKVLGGGDDPHLTPEGVRRSKDLVAALRDAGVTAIITTQLRRSVETAEPLAQALGLEPEVVPNDGKGVPANIEAVAAAVRRHPGGTVLVVGHQNTVPEIIEALGGPHLKDLCDQSYDRLFVLVPGPKGSSLVRSRYGTASPEAGPNCG